MKRVAHLAELRDCFEAINSRVAGDTYFGALGVLYVAEQVTALRIEIQALTRALEEVTRTKTKAAEIRRELRRETGLRSGQAL